MEAMKHNAFLCALLLVTVCASPCAAIVSLPFSVGPTAEERATLELLTCGSSLCFANDTRTFQCDNSMFDIFPVPDEAPNAILLLLARAENVLDPFDLESRYMAVVPKSTLAQGTPLDIAWRPTARDPAQTQCLRLGGIGQPFGTCCGACSTTSASSSLSCCRPCSAA